MRSKRYKEEKLKLTEENYSVEDAVKLIKEDTNTKFDQSVELHMKLGIDSKKAEQLIRGSVVLPAGTGKTRTIMAFVSEGQEKEAKEAGADFIGDAATIAKIKETGKVNFEIAIATPDVMKTLGPIAKTLGQKGLMPNPKTETVGSNVIKMIDELKKGKSSFRNDDGGSLHQIVGKVSFEEKDLIENITTFIDTIKKMKPEGIKGVFIRNKVLTTSMGPSIKLK